MTGDLLPHHEPNSDSIILAGEFISHKIAIRIA